MLKIKSYEKGPVHDFSKIVTIPFQISGEGSLTINVNAKRYIPKFRSKKIQFLFNKTHPWAKHKTQNPVGYKYCLIFDNIYQWLVNSKDVSNNLWPVLVHFDQVMKPNQVLCICPRFHWIRNWT